LARGFIVPKRAIWVVLLVLLLVTLPYIYAVQAGGDDDVFGGFLLNPQDGNSYLAKMYQGWRGDLRFTLPFSADPGGGGYLFLFYLFLGHLARWTGLSLPLVFHLARLLGVWVMCLALWRFLSVTMASERWRLWTFTLASLGLGMGWLVFAFGVLTADFWVAEAYPFLSAYANPHFPLGLALLLYLFTLPSEASQASVPFRSAGWKVGAAAFLLSLLSPFGVVAALIVLGGLLLWEIIARLVAGRSRSGLRPSLPDLIRDSAMIQTLIQRLAWVFILGVPWLLYDLWIARIDPQLAAWNAQNLTLTPPAWDVLLALSPALLLALPGAWRVIEQDQREARLLLVWVITGAVLIYTPLGLQRRFLMGLFVPLAGLAGYGLATLAGRFSERFARRAAALVLGLSLLTPLLILWVGIYGVQTRDPMLYLTRGEAQALDWLESNTPSQALVLAAPDTGLFIPAHTGRRVLYGHPYETVNAEAEKAQVVSFFRGELASPGAFLEQRTVDYIFYGPRERRLGPLPGEIEARQVYSSDTPGDGGVVIYQVPGEK
jgi:hypothetical protein